MDATLRQSFRHYLTTHDSYDYARFLVNNIRAGRLLQDNVALCAYLGDEKSRLVFPGAFMANTFYYFSHSLRVDEPKHIITNLRKWGHRATLTATCGVIKYLCSITYMRGPAWLSTLDEIYKRADQYKPRNLFKTEKPDGLRGYLLDNLEYPRGISTLPLRLFENLFGSIRWGRKYPGVSTLTIANGHMDDYQLYSSMLSGVRSWALGEYA